MLIMISFYLFDIIHVNTPDLHNCCPLFQALCIISLDDRRYSPASRIWLRSLKFLASVHVKQYPETLPHWSRQITWPGHCSLVGQASSVLTCHWSKAGHVIILPFIFAEFVRVRASWLDSREYQKYLDFHSPNVYKSHTQLSPLHIPELCYICQRISVLFTFHCVLCTWNTNVVN